MKRSTHAMAVITLTVPALLGTVGLASADPTTAQPSGGEATRYQIEAVITDDGMPSPIGRGMNETGTLVGWTGWPLAAFTWDDSGGLTKLPGLPGDTHRLAVDVNDAGTVVGHSGFESIEAPQHAVRWVAGIPQDLGTLPGDTDSHAEAINEAGTVVGWSTNGSTTHAFLWTEDGGMVDITPSAQTGRAYDVNEAGLVTGYAGSHAFVWAAGTLTDLGVPPGFASSFGVAVNDAGVVAAHVKTASANAEAVARWTPGVGWEVLGGVGEHNETTGINNDGTIVGRGRPSSGLQRAFVYVEGAGLRSLTELLTTNEWSIWYAFDVDDAGRIVAEGSNRFTGERATLLLKPTSRPLMHDEDLRVTVRGFSNGTAKLHVVDDAGDPIRRAIVDGSWSRNGQVVASGDTDRTNANGNASLRHQFGGLVSGEIIQFCITTITHRGHAYDLPFPSPSCASITVP